MAWEIAMVGNTEGKHSDFNNLENDDLKYFDLLEEGFEVNSPLEVKCPNSLLGVGLHDNDVLKVKVNVDDQHITLLMDVSIDMYEPEREYKLPLELGPHNDEVTMRENAPTTQSNQVASFLFPPCFDYFVFEYEVGGIPICLWIDHGHNENPQLLIFKVLCSQNELKLLKLYISEYKNKFARLRTWPNKLLLLNIMKNQSKIGQNFCCLILLISSLKSS